ncbi:MAG: DUF1080 domain-containing protein [Bacteroidota bacterium]
MSNKITFPVLLSCLLFLGACQDPSHQTVAEKPTEKVEVVELTNSITKKETVKGWTLLFDGRSLDQWKGYNMNGALPSTWQVVNGEIVGRGKDNLITKEQYNNFELTLEFKLTEAANSGIFYFVQEIPNQPIYQSAPEYQLVDNATYLETQGADFMHTHLTGDAFNLYDGIINPAIRQDKWYQARIRVNDGHVEHWLNGKQCIEYDWNSADWKERVDKTSFNKEIFAAKASGHIGLQGWGNDIKFRNIKIRRL